MNEFELHTSKSYVDIYRIPVNRASVIELASDFTFNDYFVPQMIERIDAVFHYEARIFMAKKKSIKISKTPISGSK